MGREGVGLAIVVLLPLRILGLRNSKQNLVGRGTRLTKKFHACALQELIALESIALATGYHHIIPSIKAAPASRNNVVYGKFSCRTAVLTFALVTGVYHSP